MQEDPLPLWIALVGAIAGTVAAYSVGQDQSWWNCDVDEERISEHYMDHDGGKDCLLEGVEIYGLRQ